MKSKLPRRKAAFSWLSIKTLATSLAVHVGLVAAAIFVAVQTMKPTPEPPVMVAAKKVQIPAKVREQKMAVAKHESMAPKPSFTRKLTTTAPSQIALPKMPDINLKQMLPLDPSALVSDQINSLVGAAGRGHGTGAGVSGGGGTGGTGMSFFNVKDDGRSVVIMIDVSDSMFGRTGDYDYSTRKLAREGRDQNFQIIRDEAIKLIDSLRPDSRFGIIRWSGSARLWKEELVRATDANKAEAREHIQNEVDVRTATPTGGRPGGTRHDYALEALLKLQPESAFMLTDGNATRSENRKVVVIGEDELVGQIEAAEKEVAKLPRIHTIYYMTGKENKDEESMLRAIARKTQGKFSKVKAKGVDGRN